MSSTETNKDFSLRFIAFSAQAGLVVGLLLYPFVFEKIFSMGSLRSGEWNSLMTFSITLVALAALLYYFRRRVGSNVALVFFSIVLLISVELTARLSVKIFAGKTTIQSLREQCNLTYMDGSAYKGHPFLQFTGKPSVALQGNQALGNLPPYNNFGFIGPDFHYEKPAGVIRVACLGESTTADGYPGFLESYLNKNSVDKTHRFEVMNFGHPYWTTNHSLVNFMLNVVDFHPDFIVIHHGWNEERARNFPPAEFKGDYSHAYKSFEKQDVPDKYPIRLSIIYRYLKFRYDQTPSWTTLAGSIHVDRKETGTSYSNLDELKPFRRNLENIIHIALLNNTKVVLTTLPHSTDASKPLYFAHSSLDQCNNVTRSVAAGFNENFYFVDLDSLITGKNETIFKDLGHVTDAGRALKAEAIGQVILKSEEVGSPGVDHE